MPRKLGNSRKVRLVIDGVVLQTAMGNLRTGSISNVLVNALKAFEQSYNEGYCGHGSSFWCDHMSRNVQIQIDLY